MENLTDLKKELKVTSYKIIHLMTGVSEATINAMMSEARSTDTPAGEKVLTAARKIVNCHNELIHGKAPQKRKERRVMPGQPKLF